MYTNNSAQKNEDKIDAINSNSFVVIISIFQYINPSFDPNLQRVAFLFAILIKILLFKFFTKLTWKNRYGNNYKKI